MAAAPSRLLAVSHQPLEETMELSLESLNLLAEGVGFEPTGHLRGRRFSRPLL
jgi:hypothetical protein